MRKRKKYLKIRNKQTGKVDLAHRRAASALLGRTLLPGEVVHHIDGDSTNNIPGNLLVLSSQRFHAHIEHVLRQERRGQIYLFPEMLRNVRQRARGGLFEHLAVEWASGEVLLIAKLGRLTLHVMAAVAEWEAALISQRTKDALAARRARGLPVGGIDNLSAAARALGPAQNWTDAVAATRHPRRWRDCSRRRARRWPTSPPSSMPPGSAPVRVGSGPLHRSSGSSTG